MKNFITFILYCLSVTAVIAQAKSESRVTVLAKSPTETTLRFSLSDVDRLSVTTPNGPAYVLSMDKGTPLLQKGAPDVPKFATSLLIPGTGNMAVEIVETEYQDFPNVSVAPSKGNLKRTVDPAKVPYAYGSIYEHDAFFPGRLADLQKPFVLRDVRGQALWLYPAQYNPISKVLRVYTNITVRVHHVGGAGENELPVNAPRNKSRAFQQLYQQTFLNYDTGLLNRSSNDPERMLVIAKDEYLADLEPLLVWKRQMGIHTTVVPLSEIGSSAASAIYNVVQQHYQDEGISYVLLVGDEHDMEPEMRSDGGAYSCDNCFGYMDGDDHFPEIFVGRFNAATLEQLQIMVHRNLEYERTPLVDPAQNWCATAMGSASDQGQGIGDDNQADYEQMNDWKTQQLADGYEKVWEFYDSDQSSISPTPGDESADKPGDPVNTQLISLMNGRGVSLYNYCGHGWEQGLVSGNFNTDAVTTMRNHGRYPIVVAVACCAGNFTNNDGGDCLGEALQRAGSPTGEAWGGIAGFFSSDFQSWAPPMEGQDGMNQYLIDADGVTLTPNIGAMLAIGNAKMIAAYAEGGELMADFWNMFAEPTTVPRTRLPLDLTAAHAPTTFIGTGSFLVNSPVEGALVSLYWQGQTLAVATVSGGVASLNFPPLNNVGEITVTVTQFNYLPYQGTVTVVPASGPFVVNQSVTLNDALSGNNNQQADFGETVAFDVTLANVGLELATAAAATLSTNDANVTITDDNEIFGDIEQNIAVAKPGAFAFTVNNDVADGHQVQFNLHITYSNGQAFEAVLPVKLAAPSLKTTPYELNDVVGGNGNGRLESGETAVIRITNLNVGHGQSPNAIGTLTTDSPWLTISNALILGQLDALTGTAEAAFSVTVAPNAPQSVAASFHYNVQADVYTAEQDFGPLNINPILETFESHDFTSYPWQMSGTKAWSITTQSAYTGATSARSGSILNNQKSKMNLTIDVINDGTVGFARRVSSEADYDFLYFFLDGVEMDAWSGEVAWGEVHYPVTAGVHTFTWSYEKDDVSSDGSDRAWVDDILLPPYQVVVGTHTPAAAAFDLQIIPNPTTDVALLSMELPVEQLLSVGILDCLGRRLRTVQPQTRTQAGTISLLLDLSGLTPGVYMVEVRTESGMRAEKIVKQ